MSTLITRTTIGLDSVKPEVPTSLLHDPVIIQLTWAVAIITLIIAIGKPIKEYLRSERREDKVDKVADAKTDAEAILYTHLSEQVSQYRKIADQAFKERNDLIQRVAVLESRSEDVAESKVLLERLKDRLDKKDDELQALLKQGAEERRQFLDILRAKETEIAKRDERILVLEKGLRDLEARLVKTEHEAAAFNCPMLRPQTP